MSPVHAYNSSSSVHTRCPIRYPLDPTLLNQAMASTPPARVTKMRKRGPENLPGDEVRKAVGRTFARCRHGTQHPDMSCAYRPTPIHTLSGNEHPRRGPQTADDLALRPCVAKRYKSPYPTSGKRYYKAVVWRLSSLTRSSAPVRRRPKLCLVDEMVGVTPRLKTYVYYK